MITCFPRFAGVLFAFVVLAQSWWAAQTATEKPNQYLDSDGYAVLSTVAATPRDGCGAPMRIVDQTTKPVRDILTRVSFDDADHQRQFRALAAEYDNINRIPLELLPRFSPRERYTLLPHGFVSGANRYLQVSAVAFDKEKTLALVSVENQCGCVVSHVLVLEKQDGKWQEVNWPGKHFDQATCD